MSDEDRQLIASEGIDRGKIRVVPNGVNVEWFQEKPRQEPARPTVLFVGTFKWLPNQEAVQFLVREIWPSLKQMVPGVQLHIVGFDPPASIQSLAVSDSDISVRGDIVDIRDAFRQAQVLVAPVLSGKGTRYKVLEAMAAGTAVIATSTAVEGLGVHDGREVLIANTPHALAQATANALLDKKLRANLASAAATFVARNYDWPLISHKLDTIYRSIRA